MLLLIHLIITGFFLALGLILYRGKGAALIAGYNTATPAEKAQYDGKKLCRGVGKLMFALAGCWLVIASSEIFHTLALLWAGLALFMLVILGGVIYMNTGNRFHK